jgi:WD40 repeat protein
MTAGLDVSTSKFTAYTVDSWNPPMAYGSSATMAAGELPDDSVVGQKRSRQYTPSELNSFWSASSFLTKSASPYVSGDSTQRATVSEAFAVARKHRSVITSKSPPPVVGFLVADENSSDSLNSVNVNVDATLCAASIHNKTIIWSLPSSTSDHSSSKTYNALFLPHGKQRFEIPTGSGTTSLVFSPDAPVLLSASSRGQIGLWSVEAARKMVSYSGHSSRTPVWSVAWSPAGGYFCSGSGDGVARIWRSDIPFPIRALTPDDGSVHCHMVKWHPSCQVVAVASTMQICLFEISGPAILFRFDCKKATAMDFSPTGYLFACANSDSLVVWETCSGSALFRFDTFSAIVGLSWTFPSTSGLGDGGLKSVFGQGGQGHPVLVSVDESGRVKVWDKLYISKPSICELSLVEGLRPLHMHVTPRNLVVVAGARENTNLASLAALEGL